MPKPMSMKRVKAFIKRAKAAYEKEGFVEVDNPPNDKDARAMISAVDGNPNGAYVKAWVWVDL